MSTSRKIDLMFDNLKKYRPDVVFINLGGNDMRKPTDIDKLVEKLKDIVDELYYNGVSRIFVTSIIERGRFPKFTCLDKKTFDKIRRSVNKKLRAALGPDLVDVGKKIKYPRHYDSDLVHPGRDEGGLYLLKKLL